MLPILFPAHPERFPCNPHNSLTFSLRPQNAGARETRRVIISVNRLRQVLNASRILDLRATFIYKIYYVRFILSVSKSFLL